MTPREELEARLTALLLGELPPEEAASLQQAIAQDAELARLHNQLKQAIALVRETVAAPEHETAAIADAPKLSAERREKLLASFKVVRPKELKRTRWARVKWSEVKWRDYAAVAAMLIGLLAVGALLFAPTLASVKEHASVAGGNSEGFITLFERRKSRAQGMPLAGDLGAPVDATFSVTESSPDGSAAKLSESAQFGGVRGAAGNFDKMRGLNLPSGGKPPGQPRQSEQTFADNLSTAPPAPPQAAPTVDANQSLERSPRHFAGIALPTLGDSIQPNSEFMIEERQLGRVAGGSQTVQSDSFRAKLKENNEGIAGGDLYWGRVGGGGGAPSAAAGAEPASSSLDKSLAAGSRGNVAKDRSLNASDSGLAMNGPGAVRYFTTPAPGTPPSASPDTAAKNFEGRFGDFDRNGIVATTEPKDRPAGTVTDETATLFAKEPEAPRPALLLAQPASPAATPPPAFVPAPKLDSLEDNVQLADGAVRLIPMTNSAVVGANFTTAGNVPTPTTQNEWFGIVPQDGRGFGGFGAQQTFKSSFGAAAVEMDQKANKPVQAGDAGALGVFSQNAVGFTSIDLSKAKPPQAIPDTDGDGTKLNYNWRINGSPASEAKDQAIEGNKLAEASKGAEYVGVTLAPVALAFDAEAKQSGIESKRESVRALGEKPMPAQQTADESNLRKRRIEIALPGGERGEVLEKLQVATGPVVSSEVMYQTPSRSGETTLAGQATTDKKEELRHKLDSIRIPELTADSLPLGQVIETLNREAKKADPRGKGINIIVNDTTNPTPVSAVVDPATGLPVQAVTGANDDFMATTVNLVPPVQDLTLGEALQVISKVANPPVKLSVENYGVVISATDKQKPSPVNNPALVDSSKAVRDIESLQYMRDRLQTRVWQEKVDAAMPKSGIVEIIDRAESQPEKKPTLWDRVRGAVSGEVERSARIAVAKDATDIAGIDGPRPSADFDPYWQQSQLEKIQSKEALGKVIDKLNLNETWAGKYGVGGKLNTEDTMRRLKKMIDVRSDPKTSVINIGAKSEDPEEAARIANAVAEVYRDARLNSWKERSSAGLAALTKEIAEQEDQINRAQQELERRKKELNPNEADVPLPKLAAGAPIPQPEVATAENAFSTFSLNVSDVSFKLAAAALEKGQMPDPATVRSEEFINAFDYRDPEPAGSAPIAFAWERARYPFAHDRDLVRFSVKTAASGRQSGRPLNLVLLLDNSGSMERADRIRIRGECLRVLVSQLQPPDRVSVVAFARTARLWVDGLPGNQAGELPQRVGTLTPEGGTNLEDAMNLAYQTARRHFLANGVNRVVLLTDGAANLGDVEPESLKKKVEAQRKQGIALDCFGIGWDGLNDELLETLSRNGDGRYGFINSPEAAQDEFAGQLAGALKVAASDVKVQVEWNPRRVTAYRQIGYAKHQLKKEQFRDNTVDAAEIGAAEAGNALYTVQVNPRGEGPLGTVRVRFKVPGTSDYREHEWPLTYDGGAKPLDQSGPTLRLAASASAFSEWLVSSPFAAEVTPDKLLGYLGGVPEAFSADPRPKKLEWMIRQAKSVAGK